MKISKEIYIFSFKKNSLIFEKGDTSSEIFIMKNVKKYIIIFF